MRIDTFLTVRGEFSSRTKAQRAIDSGSVLVNGIVAKCSDDVSGSEDIQIIQSADYVSIGKFKLEHAVQHFNVTIANKICVDIGASTGGFTEVLLHYGATRVYCVDVGEHQLCPQIATDNKVVIMDRTNARSLAAENFEDKIDFVTADVSFISIKQIIPNICNILQPNGEGVLLVKPQFEVGRAGLNKNGIVTSDKVRLAAVNDVVAFANLMGLSKLGLIETPKMKEKGNIEYLLYIKRER